ncbi:MAG: hypothetical protein ACLPID_20305 [Beijerinckiaceae bacterium]
MFTYSSWIEEKSKLAHALASGSCGGTYADGAIILCTSISAMASLMWPARARTDRKRFIEIVVKFPRNGFDATMISAPLLSQERRDLQHKLRVSDIAFRYTADNDKSENEVLSLCFASPSPIEDKKFVRRYSYACLLYEHVRCAFIHTYNPTDSATIGDSIRDVFEPGSSRITYVNYLAASGMRRIYFPLEWISEVAKNIAVALDGQCARLNRDLGERLDIAVPSAWWIDGA